MVRFMRIKSADICLVLNLCLSILLLSIYFSISGRMSRKTTTAKVLAHNDSFCQVKEKVEPSRDVTESPHIVTQERLLQEMRRRSRNLSEMCNKQTKQSAWNNAFMFVFPEYNLTWCAAPKTASTSIAFALLQVTKNKYNTKLKTYPQKLLHQAYKEFSTRQTLLLKERHSSFFIVRHPFERLVSAFRNKFENMKTNHDGKYFFNNFAKSIIKKYRKPSNKVNLKNDEIQDPYFEEFIDYVLDTPARLLDPHWRPITLLCNVCLYGYEFIVKMETFQTEMRALVDFYKETGHLPSEFSIPWENKVKSKVKAPNNQITMGYLHKLKKEKIKLLYKIYKQDFDYFNYNMDNYVL